LSLIAIINAFLHNAATVLMASNLLALSYHLVINELFVLSVLFPRGQQLEENVVAINFMREMADLWRDNHLDCFALRR